MYNVHICNFLSNIIYLYTFVSLGVDLGDAGEQGGDGEQRPQLVVPLRHSPDPPHVPPPVHVPYDTDPADLDAGGGAAPPRPHPLHHRHNR